MKTINLKILLVFFVIYVIQLIICPLKLNAFVGIAPPISIPESPIKSSSSIGIDNFSGSPNYQFEFALPPGTNDLKPELMVEYSGSGTIGQDWLENNLKGLPQKYFNVEGVGRRFIDLYEDTSRIANESKVGYQTLTESNKTQIIKDAALIKSKEISGAVYHFFTSPITGQGGPSGPLREFIEDNIGKVIKEH
jgi:hypothetical protein